MKKFRLLLLDANIVIEISRHGLWDRLTERCVIHLAQTVVDEAQFYEDEDGTRHYIDLTKCISEGKIVVFNRKPSQLSTVSEQFDPLFLEKLDPGELESLSYLLDQEESDCSICSADKIVFRVLGALHRAEQGVSLAEVLSKIGLTRALQREFTQSYREQWTQKGFEEGLQGRGIKPGSLKK